MGSKFDGSFGCTAELFLGSKSLEKLQVNAQGKMKPIDPGEYRLVMKVDAKAKIKLGPGLEFEETTEVTWKVVVADDGSLSFDDRKTGKLKYEYLVGGMTLDKYEAGGDKARMGVEIEDAAIALSQGPLYDRSKEKRARLETQTAETAG